MKRIEVSKGTIVESKGSLNSKAYRVEKGLIRTYSIDEKGKEHIFLFGPEGWIIADNVSAEIPTELFIDALEDSVLTVYEKTKHPQPDVMKLMKRIKTLQKRVIMLMSASAIERYEDFIETYPDIVQRVPQRMIASYLGITPEALSKVKRERLKGK